MDVKQKDLHVPWGLEHEFALWKALVIKTDFIRMRIRVGGG